MNTTTSRRLSLALILCTTFLSAQKDTPPDLSGTWQMNPGKSKFSKVNEVHSQTLTIKQEGDQIEFHFNIDGKRTAETYTSDKKEKVVQEIPEAGTKIVAKAYWKGRTLITESKTVSGASSPLAGYELMHMKDAWTLSSDGQTLTDKSQSDEGPAEMVYDKQ
jgi:hypothetical protein